MRESIAHKQTNQYLYTRTLLSTAAIQQHVLSYRFILASLWLHTRMALPEDLDALCTQQLFRAAESSHLEDFDLSLDLQTGWSAPCGLSWAAEVVGSGGAREGFSRHDHVDWGRGLEYKVLLSADRSLGTTCQIHLRQRTLPTPTWLLPASLSYVTLSSNLIGGDGW